MNYLSGSPTIEAVGPNGDPISLNDPSLAYETRNQVQLFTVEDPQIGDWEINLGNEDQDNIEAVFSLLISTSPCDEPREMDDEAELPYLLTLIGTPNGTRFVVAAVVLLGGFTAFVIQLRQRRNR